METQRIPNQRAIILSVILLIVTINHLCAQKITRDDTPDIAGTVCPNVNVSYTLDVSNTAYTNCYRSWAATGGTIQSNKTGSKVTVSWSDTPNGTASLKCTLSGCLDSNGRVQM